MRRTLLDIADFFDGSADGVQQRGGTAGLVILRRDRADRADVDTVVQQAVIVVKQRGGDAALAGRVLLLFEHRVEPADGIRFQPAHGTAFVQYEDQFRQFLFHDVILLVFVRQG